MHRLSSSQLSLNESLFDVSISGSSAQNQRLGHLRKVGLMTSLSVATEKRPSDFFLARNNNDNSSAALSRPKSNVSTSSETSKDSDDGVLVVLTPFDVMESRLSSATAASVYLKNMDLDLNHKLSALERELPAAPIVSSTANLVSRPLPDLPEVPSFTSSSPPKTQRQLSSSSHLDASGMFPLTRTKTRYYNPKEKKERQQLRKKLYEENNDDDVIMSQDLSLVFNVPVIKKHHEIYTHSQSSKSSYFSRDDIVKVDDNKYNAFKQPIKPCPLPGVLALSRSKSGSSANPSSVSFHDDSSSADLHLTSYQSIDTDEEVSRNISDFYALRSESYSKLVRASRDSHIYKLPHYIRSQNSIEDISLVSPEKLELIDQSRPINLPPKSSEDISKHRREINRVLKNVETTNKSQSLSRQKFNDNLATVQSTWNKVFLAGKGKDLSNTLNSEKEKLRSYIWENQTHDTLTYNFFSKVLQLNLGNDAVNQMRSEYDQVEATHHALSEQTKATKNAEFDSIITHVTSRPLIYNFIQEAKESVLFDFNYTDFVKNFRHLLYLKSLSDGGLKKHHQIFSIPIFLILFRGESMANVYLMIEMFDAEIFSDEVFADLSKKLSGWSNLSSMSYSSATYKVLSRFSSLEEFETLNTSTIFELMLQLNDKLPLSLSAPSTPIISRGSFLSYNKIVEEPGSDSLDSVQSLSNSSDSLLNSVLTYNASISSSHKLLLTFLNLLVIYSRSRKRTQNLVKLLQSFLLTLFDYYHIGWNTSEELVKKNGSIRVNHTNDQWANLESFTSKWKQTFKKM